jgi:hypothetical protein
LARQGIKTGRRISDLHRNSPSYIQDPNYQEGFQYPEELEELNDTTPTALEQQPISEGMLETMSPQEIVQIEKEQAKAMAEMQKQQKEMQKELKKEIDNEKRYEQWKKPFFQF